jgi:uncharacterized protein
MHTVILDTNIVLVPFTLGVDIYEQIPSACDFSHKLVIFEGVCDELTKLMQDSDVKKQAKLAFALIQSKVTQNNVTMLPIRGHVDDAILHYVRAHKNCIVATQDKQLKAELKKENIPTLVLRQKKYIKLIN